MTNSEHILTLDRDADLDTVISALGAFDIRVVCVSVDVETAFERTHQLTVRPRVEIDLPVIDYIVRGVGVELLDLRPLRHSVCGC